MDNNNIDINISAVKFYDQKIKGLMVQKNVFFFLLSRFLMTESEHLPRDISAFGPWTPKTRTKISRFKWMRHFVGQTINDRSCFFFFVKTEKFVPCFPGQTIGFLVPTISVYSTKSSSCIL